MWGREEVRVGREREDLVHQFLLSTVVYPLIPQLILTYAFESAHQKHRWHYPWSRVAAGG